MRITKEVPLAGSFCTGTQSSCPVAEVRPDSPLDPDGELAYMVRQRLDEGQSLKRIAAALDLTWMQVLGVAQSVSSPDFVIHGDHHDDVSDAGHVEVSELSNDAADGGIVERRVTHEEI